MTLGWALLAASLWQTAAVPPAPSVRTVEKGALSDLSTARQATVTDRDAWVTLWRAHAPARPLPEVDFAREMVVAVFLGTRPTAGFGVEIVGVRGEVGALVVQYRETRPSRDALTAQVLTAPYHLAAIPKRPGTVTFEKLTP